MMMRNSNLSSSSFNNQSDTALISCHENYVQDQEESGWTSYFDDFFSNKTHHLSSSKHMDNMAYDDHDEDDDEESNCSSHAGSGSVVLSDAASCAAWSKQFQYKNCDERAGNRRADALAACSSFDGTQMVIHKKLRFKRNINRNKRSNDYYDDSLEDTASSPVNSPKAKGSEVYGYDHQQGQELGLKQQVVEDNKSLKEKGLCLVPYSMLMNYIG